VIVISRHRLCPCLAALFVGCVLRCQGWLCWKKESVSICLLRAIFWACGVVVKWVFLVPVLQWCGVPSHPLFLRVYSEALSDWGRAVWDFSFHHGVFQYFYFLVVPFLSFVCSFFGNFFMFFRFRLRHMMDANFHIALIEVAPVPAPLLFCSSVHIFFATRPCRKLSHPISVWCWCCWLVSVSGVSSFMSPPSSLIACDARLCHSRPLVLLTLLSLVSRLVSASSRCFRAVSLLHEKTCFMFSFCPQNGHASSSLKYRCILSPVAHSFDVYLTIGIIFDRLTVSIALAVKSQAMLLNCFSCMSQCLAKKRLKGGSVSLV
jgi:hypothetical protein